MAEKPHMNLVFIGHVDHGKSTLVGRMLLETGHIEKHIIDKFREEAEAKGKGSFEFAWVMDALKEERERGLTIDVAHKRFNSDKYYFTSLYLCSLHSGLVASILFIATTSWPTPKVLAKNTCSFVWAITPSGAATTSTAASAWLVPVIMFLTKSLWPGASIIVK